LAENVSLINAFSPGEKSISISWPQSLHILKDSHSEPENASACTPMNLNPLEPSTESVKVFVTGF